MNRIRALIVMFAVSLAIGVSNVGRCHAEEPLFLDDNPRRPLVSAQIGWRDYLDLDSCEVISNDADGFEISAKCNNPDFPDNDHIYRFRKNKESEGELQIQDWYDKKWKTIYDPHDKETVERVLEERDYINFRLDDYYMFKCVYQELFGKPYDDDFDDEALRRSAILLWRDGERPGIHKYLWDDENYPKIWHHGGGQWAACYIDKSSLYIEDENPPFYTLQILMLDTPLEHYNDIMPRSISQARYLYDDENKIMYCNMYGKASWYRLNPEGSSKERGYWAFSAGKAAFRLAYGRDFFEGARKDGYRYDRPMIYPSDKKLFTDNNGTNYYLRRFRKTDIWIEAQVMREKADGTADSFIYRVYTYQVQCPYTIYSGASFKHPGEAVERGELYVDSDGTLRSDANSSTVAFFEWFWTKKLGREARR